MTARVMVLVVLAAARGVWWLVEQPRTSLMELHPTFQRMLALLQNVRRISVCLGDFGGPTKKPTILYSRILPCMFGVLFHFFCFGEFG